MNLKSKQSHVATVLDSTGPGVQRDGPSKISRRQIGGAWENNERLTIVELKKEVTEFQIIAILNRRNVGWMTFTQSSREISQKVLIKLKSTKKDI